MQANSSNVPLTLALAIQESGDKTRALGAFRERG